METITNMLNEIVIVMDEEDKCLKAVVKFQAMFSLDEFQELMKELTTKTDGTFKTTLL